MRVVVLGTAAGGGVPQWNCACANCCSAREGTTVSRTQDCLAVSGDGTEWYLVNASPDIRHQLTACPALVPGPGPRQTPLRGVFLTDGELDHTLGLFQLKEAEGLRVWAPAAVLGSVAARKIVDSYRPWEWEPLDGGVLLGNLRVDVLAVSDKRPKYAADVVAEGPWVVAYRFTDTATGGALVYAPCLAQWPEGFDEFCAGADYVLLDGSFHEPEEMATTTHGDVPSPAQSAMGHLPVAGPNGSLARIRRMPGRTRWLYTHVNNTNPVLDPSSAEVATIVEAGAGIATDGTVLRL
ncbi:pyrroloquinoline quinone biosynthesis protein PqqB [Saccharomonospora cyanea]|uniref:Coenzyme PQQ synthesis protein B n=1 Tax=Saccharomonospora cyanea NA-134 TaxID=882082 RepID=H5XQY9_9PSEU|nr:pyrroloquinoline quinone biosynthesis protein PqqB [Saccharomonospora cyanea]EHR61229.1 metal-dependent hydrolase, beta-lactamase superfamily I [Saccharomonospora cyanea NA-134]